MADWIRIDQARKQISAGVACEVRGWVRTRRDSKGGFSFIEINDGSCFGNLQVVAPAELDNYESEVKKLTAGCSVVVTGDLKESPAKGQATELHADAVRVLGWADPETYPLQKKRHSFEKLREWAHLRTRTNTLGAVMRVRDRISQSTHHFFDDEGFFYVNTPIITASDCEGAGEMFRVTTLDLDRLAKSGGPVKYEYDFFEKPAYLTVSGQLNAETYATSLGRVYTFGPTFRAENSNTSRHLAEFWMVEPEAAFCDLADNMRLAEAYLKRLFSDCLNGCEEDMQFFDERIQKGLIDQLTAVVEKPFQHMTYTQAIDVLTSSNAKFDYPVKWGIDLQAEHERYLTEQHVEGPLILTDYPSSIKPFYMKVSDDGKTVAAMDVLVPGVGEIIGGSQREERLDVLQSRMDQAGLNQDDYWWYLDLRRFGTVPHAGFGLGLERAVQYATGMSNIRDVIPFPRTRATRTSRVVVGRLAPSPTGAQHLGNARTYLATYWSAIAQGARLILRIEDIDSPRVKPWAIQQAIDDLKWLGIAWDEGPDCPGTNGPYVQTQRVDRYQAAIDQLRQVDRIYPCTCTRKDIAKAASAPHDGDDVVIYPGTCAPWRQGDALPDAGTYCWRFRVCDEPIEFTDGFAGRLSKRPASQLGDFPITRKTGDAAYQLAVVVDDLAMGVTEVVRGDDLIDSTFWQLELYAALGHQPRRLFIFRWWLAKMAEDLRSGTATRG